MHVKARASLREISETPFLFVYYASFYNRRTYE